MGAIAFSAQLISPQKVGKWVLRGETQGRTLGWEPEGRESIGDCGGLLTMRSLEWVVIGSPEYQRKWFPAEWEKRPLKKKETKHKLGSFARTAQTSPLVTNNLRSQHPLSREVSLQ